ncbi:hypothetical protein BDR03DRAFT_955736 [Suillus americanus]|nr:hypothetical protein BDR03DRAFT_955736 [Suillus americanus]
MIVTCTIFALYTKSFTKSSNQALTAAESGDGDQAMDKRWEFLKKFESNLTTAEGSIVCVWDLENEILMLLVSRFKAILFHSHGYRIPG